MSVAKSPIVPPTPDEEAALVAAEVPDPALGLVSTGRVALYYALGLVAAAMPMALLSGDLFWVNLFTYTYLFAGLAVAWNVIAGFGGQFSLGHGVFFAVGAYTTVRLYLGWQLSPWLGDRVELPVGPLFCIIDGPTRGRSWSSAGVRIELRRLATQAGVRRRFAPHQLRHAHAVELAREGVPLNVIQRQLGHANLGTTSIYLQGIDTEEIIATVHARRAPMVPVRATLEH